MRLTKITRNKSRQLSRRVLSFTLSAALAVNSLLAGMPVFNPPVANAATAFNNGFEIDTNGWLPNPTPITHANSGDFGITSSSGSKHAIVSGSTYTNFGGYESVFPANGYTTSVDVYLDPAWPAGSGFDYSVASNGSDGNHRRDFIFHAAKDTSTNQLLVGASNNSNNSTIIENLESGEYSTITTAGWYRIKHFFNNVSNQLSVDIVLEDVGGNPVFMTTRSDSSDLIPSVVGGHRYGWFTFANVPSGLAIDNTSLITAPFTPVCTYDFQEDKMWEVTWGYGFADRNGGAPTFDMTSNGGMTSLNGAAIPEYMTNYGDGDDWHWLYITDNGNYSPRHNEYGFADGTVRTVDYSWTEVAGCYIPTDITWGIAPTLSFVANYIDHAQYDGISLEIKTPNLTDGNGIEITVERTNGTPDVWTNKPGAVMSGLNTTHNVTAPIVIVEGTRTRTSSGSWQTTGEPWNATQEPTSVTVRITRDGGPDLLQTITPIGSVFGATWSDIAANLPQITNVDAYYTVGAGYTAISTDFTTKNITNATNIELRVNRADASTYSITAKQSVIDDINAASPVTRTGPIVITGSRTSSSWNNQTGTWSGPSLPESVDVIITLANGDVLTLRDNVIAETLASQTEVLPTDSTAPSTPEITSPTARQWFKSTPIVNAWTASTDDSGSVDHYQVAYHYDDNHTFGGSTCSSLVLDGKTVSGCRDTNGTSRNHNPGSGEEGGVTIWVRAFDAAGNASAWSDSVHYYYDHTIPTTDIVAPTGTVGNSFTVSGDAHDNLSLNRVYVQLVNRENSQRYGGTTINLIPNGINSAGVDAHWSKTFDASSLGLPNGTYAAHVAVVDMAGNTSTAGWTANFTVDSTAPEVSGIVLNGQTVADSDVRSANCTVPTNYYLVNGAIDLDATITDALSNVSSAKYKIRKVSAGGCTQTAIYQSSTANMTNVGGNDWETVAGSMINTNTDVDLVDGNYTIQMTVQDSVGNQAIKYVDITVDNTKPTVLGASLSHNVFNSSHPGPTVSGSVNGTGSNVDYVQYRIHTAGVADVPGFGWVNLPAADGTFDSDSENFTGDLITTGLSNGDYIVRIRAFDAAGNKRSGIDLAFTVDNDAPVVIINSPSNGDVLNGPVQVKGTVTDANPHHYWLHITKDGSTIVNQVVNHSSSFSNSVLSTLTDNGAYKVTLAARDSADNRSGDVVVEFIIDNLSPVISIDNVNVSLDKKLSFDISVVEQGLAGLKIVAANIYDATNTIKVLSLGSGNPTRLNTPHEGFTPGEFNFNQVLGGINVSGWTTGTYTIRAFASDHAGNEHRFFTLTFDVDNTAPEAPTNLGWTTTLSQVIANGGTTNEETGTASWDASVSDDVDHYVYKYWNNISSSPYNDEASAWTTNAGLTLGGVFNQGEGTHFFCVVAVDFAGNESACSDVFEITYDVTEPGLVLANVEDNTSTSRTISGTGEAGAEIEVTVHSTPQTKNTIVDGNGDWSLDFDGLEVGNHTVNAVSKDAAGNTSIATTTFEVLASNTDSGQVQGIQDNRNLTPTPTPTQKQGSVLAALTELPGTGASTAAFAVVGGLTTLVGATLTIRRRQKNS